LEEDDIGKFLDKIVKRGGGGGPPPEGGPGTSLHPILDPQPAVEPEDPIPLIETSRLGMETN
jgi:hypothetical protein